MADFTLSKPIFGGKQPKTSTAGTFMAKKSSVIFLQT